MHKHIIIPVIDFMTGMGLNYLFYVLALKSYQMQTAKARNPLFIDKNKRANYNTEELNNILLGSHTMPNLQLEDKNSYISLSGVDLKSRKDSLAS